MVLLAVSDRQLIEKILAEAGVGRVDWNKGNRRGQTPLFLAVVTLTLSRSL